MSEAHSESECDHIGVALSEREENLARVLRIAGVGGIGIDVAGDMRSWRSPEYLQLHGLPDDVREETHAQWLERVHPDDRERAETALFAALEGTGATYDNEYRIIRPSDGAVRWIRARAEIERDATGKARRLVGAHSDVTEQKEAQHALRASEERLRSAVQVGGLGLWDWNVLTGEVHWSEEHYHLHGYAIGEITPSYEAWTERIHPADREAAEDAIRHAMDTGEEYTREFRTVYPDGSVRWVSGRGRFFYNADGRPFRMIGAMVDTTERREAEERQKVLLAELQHRVRNILAVVRSIFTRTAEDERTIAEVASHFTGRLDSLARTQVLVTQNSDGLVDLEVLIRDEMLSVGSAEIPTVRVKGPEVALPPKEAEAIGLAIHELTTNAIKYGALSRREGALEISWAVNMHHREPRRLVLNWIERGVPAVPVIPSNQGFGSELIREALPYRLGAATRLEFVGGGVQCEIALDLPADAKVLG